MDGSWCDLAGLGLHLCLVAFKKVAYVALTCTFAVGGALIGSVSGALKGQTTETGFVRGAAIGVITGTVVSFDVLDSCLQGDFLSKVSIIESLINGKIFREWVSPAILKAYQWQINMLEVEEDVSDIFDDPDNPDITIGLSPESIKKLPVFEINCGETTNSFGEASCAVCLQDLKGGENGRKLHVCGHLFHMVCIDRWLMSHASCPICRYDLQDPSKLDTACFKSN